MSQRPNRKQRRAGTRRAAGRNDRIGDGPLREQMVALANAIDEVMNGARRGLERDWGFVLLVFPFGDLSGSTEHRANYVSNARREDIVTLLREQLARFEEQEQKLDQEQEQDSEHHQDDA